MKQPVNSTYRATAPARPKSLPRANEAVYNTAVADADPILLVSEPIRPERLMALADLSFGDMVKAVVDVTRRLVALGAELHSDEEAALLQQGSAQVDLWGINIYPDKPRPEWIEFDPMINLRPRSGNRSRFVEDPGARQLIIEIVDALVG